MVDREALLQLVDRIYRSVEEPRLWPETIDAIGELVSGRRGFWTAQIGEVHGQGISQAYEAHTFFLSRADLRFLDQCADEFGELIIRFLKIIFLSILASPQACGHEAIGMRMARRFLPSCDGSDGAVLPSKAAMRNLIAALWEDGRLVTAERLQALRLLTPHLDRASRLHMRLIEMSMHSNLLSAALDRLTLGIVLVDGAGMPIWLNWRAQEIIDQGQRLRLVSSGLAAQNPSETRHLRALIQRVASGGEQGLLPISRGEELSALLVLAVPLTSRTAILAGSGQLACGALFIADPEISDDPSASALREAFGLTYREAQTAIAVSRGQGLHMAAKQMGVALTTARSQLQQVFAKTGTRHQAELVRLVHGTVGKLRF